MNESPHVPILMYRDFYDIPRMVVIRHTTTLLLLDCIFDEQNEEYVDYFSIYALDTITEEAITVLTDWNTLAGYGRILGRIPVGDVEFDPTRRNYIHGRVVEYLDAQQR